MSIKKLETSVYYTSTRNDVGPIRHYITPGRVFITRYENINDAISDAEQYTKEYEAQVVRVDYFSDGSTIETVVWVEHNE